MKEQSYNNPPRRGDSQHSHHWELKSYEGSFGYGKLSKMIRRVSTKEQSDRIILNINHDISIKTATESIEGLFRHSAKVRQQIKHVIIVDKNGQVHSIK